MKVTTSKAKPLIKRGKTPTEGKEKVLKSNKTMAMPKLKKSAMMKKGK